jgi:hypothetical protein
MVAAMAYLKKLVTNGENIGTTLKFSPLVASMILSPSETNTKNDNLGFLKKHLQEIENLREVQSLADYMQNSEMFKKYYKKKFDSGVLTEEGRELSAESRRLDIMRRFISILFISYASRSKVFPKFSKREFYYVYSRMEMHLYGDMSEVELLHDLFGTTTMELLHSLPKTYPRYRNLYLCRTHCQLPMHYVQAGYK